MLNLSSMLKKMNIRCNFFLPSISTPPPFAIVIVSIHITFTYVRRKTSPTPIGKLNFKPCCCDNKLSIQYYFFFISQPSIILKRTKTEQHIQIIIRIRIIRISLDKLILAYHQTLLSISHILLFQCVMYNEFCISPCNSLKFETKIFIFC